MLLHLMTFGQNSFFTNIIRFLDIRSVLSLIKVCKDTRNDLGINNYFYETLIESKLPFPVTNPENNIFYIQSIDFRNKTLTFHHISDEQKLKLKGKKLYPPPPLSVQSKREDITFTMDQLFLNDEEYLSLCSTIEGFNSETWSSGYDLVVADGDEKRKVLFEERLKLKPTRERLNLTFILRIYKESYYTYLDFHEVSSLFRYDQIFLKKLFKYSEFNFGIDYGFNIVHKGYLDLRQFVLDCNTSKTNKVEAVLF